MKADGLHLITIDLAPSTQDSSFLFRRVVPAAAIAFHRETLKCLLIGSAREVLKRETE
jgi:hypothetical protein